MHELSFKTTRIRRGSLRWLKRLRPCYETRLTDGERVAYGKGRSVEASMRSAQRNWDALFEITAASAGALAEGRVARATLL
jgi:hypothetical protein